MSLWRLAIASLRYFWRTNLALLMGVAIGTAVLTGALIVGDSVRGSLRSLTLERLGMIDEILLSELFFREELAMSLDEVVQAELSDVYSHVLPAILLNRATVEVLDRASGARAQSVTVLGASDSFWELSTAGDVPHSLGADQIIINRTLAEELGAVVGDRLAIRIGKSSGLAGDSPLARTDDLVESIVDLEVVDIIPSSGLGRFSLQASQQVPTNAFVSLKTLQEGLNQTGRSNAILVAGVRAGESASDSDFRVLREAVRPQLDDLGISLDRVEIGYKEDGEQKTILEYDTLTNDRMLFPPEQETVIATKLSSWTPQPVFTFLATKIQKLDTDKAPTGRIVSYSTMTGIDSTQHLGPLMDDSGQPIEIQDNQIVLNSWAAETLEARIDDAIRVTFFEPETAHGEPVERSQDFVVKAIVPITEPARPFSRRRPASFDSKPTLANDPDLTPYVDGITDAETVERWDAPFPMDRSLPPDDDYWQHYRTTPKAFVSLGTARRLWASRFGETTSYRIPVAAESVAERRASLAAFLASDYESFGLHWIRAKKDGLLASSGTTPFDALFLGFSMFIIASALILVSLLLRLNLEQRASQLGLVGALGFDWRRSFLLLITENASIVLIGGLIGMLIGVAYAWLMLAGLRTWWVDAIATPFMRLVLTPRSLGVGFMLGAIAAFLTIAVTLRRLKSLSPSRLMSGKAEPPAVPGFLSKRTHRFRFVPWGLFGLALVLDVLAPSLPPEPQGGAFFGAGACALVALLMLLSGRFKERSSHATDGSNLSVRSLAARNLTRSPTRSTLTIGIVAASCFLIVAISAFRLAPTEEGTGGFELIGVSDQPIFEEIQSREGERVFSLRLQDGDDASCRNLYQSSRPRLIGISQHFIDHADEVGLMDWASVEQRVEENVSSWAVLAGESSPNSEAIPVVLDKNTAMYGMQIYTGVGTEFERDYGAAGTLRFRIVGLLSGSIFQGSLLVPEAALKERFPRTGGYRYFLVDAQDPQAVAATLEETYSDQGLDLTDSKLLLTELLAVQNTYLSTFQSLGGLGLLLGTLGLAAVQLRNVIQRRGELAILRATGFRTGQLSLLVLHEHAMLLLGGLTVGVVAALFVILPHMFLGGASVPVLSLFFTLLLVAVVGLASALFAERYLQRMPLLASLTSE